MALAEGSDQHIGGTKKPSSQHIPNGISPFGDNVSSQLLAGLRPSWEPTVHLPVVVYFFHVLVDGLTDRWNKWPRSTEGRNSEVRRIVCLAMYKMYELVLVEMYLPL